MTFDFGDGNGFVPAHRHPNGGGWVADSIIISPGIYIGPRARIYGGEISGGEIYGGVISGGVIYGGVISGGEISGGAWGDINPVQIQGSRDFVIEAHDNQIRVGCELHDRAWWLENYLEVGLQFNYSEAQIAEYHEYLLLIDRIVALR